MPLTERVDLGGVKTALEQELSLLYAAADDAEAVYCKQVLRLVFHLDITGDYRCAVKYGVDPDLCVLSAAEEGDNRVGDVSFLFAFERDVLKSAVAVFAVDLEAEGIRLGKDVGVESCRAVCQDVQRISRRVPAGGVQRSGAEHLFIYCKPASVTENGGVSRLEENAVIAFGKFFFHDGNSPFVPSVCTGRYARSRAVYHKKPLLSTGV